MERTVEQPIIADTSALVSLTGCSQFILVETTSHVEAALAKFKEQPEAVSFTDCIVMALADHYNTKDIFGFDKQFEDAGYHRLERSTEWKKAA